MCMLDTRAIWTQTESNFIVDNKDNKDPFYLAEDLERFYNLTRGDFIVMDESMWNRLVNTETVPNESINIVITDKELDEISGGYSVNTAVSLSKALLRVANHKKFDDNNSVVWIVGSVELYDTALNRGLIESVYRTIIENTGSDYDKPMWQLNSSLEDDFSLAKDKPKDEWPVSESGILYHNEILRKLSYGITSR